MTSDSGAGPRDDCWMMVIMPLIRRGASLRPPPPPPPPPTSLLTRTTLRTTRTQLLGDERTRTRADHLGLTRQEQVLRACVFALCAA